MKKRVKWGVWGSFILIIAGSGGTLLEGNDCFGMNFSVDIKERLILRVRSGSQTYEAGGYNRADVTTHFSMNDNPVYVEVLARVQRNQYLHLQVQEIAQTWNHESEIEWTASGIGFQGGALSNIQANTMANWVGSGKYEGVVNFFYKNSSAANQNRTHTIHYSLIAI